MVDNFLKLNDDKIERRFTGNPKRMARLQNFQLLVGDNALRHQPAREMLGPFYDSTLPFKTYKNNTDTSAMYHSGILAASRDHFSRELTSRLCSSLGISRLDNWNSILAGIPKYSLRPLQLASIMTARVVFNARRSCHVSHLLDLLKLLPRKQLSRKQLSTECLKSVIAYALHTADLPHACVPARA